MTPVEFRISFAAAIGLAADIATRLDAAVTPKWRILSIDLRRVEKTAFELLLRLHPDDLGPKTASIQDLRAFRDIVLAMVAVIAVTPIIPLSKGTYTFPLGGDKFQQTSLGPMVLEGSTVPLRSVAAVVAGAAATDAVRAAAYFLWQALNADNALYRFINLATCSQILANTDSSVQGSTHPKCPHPKCRHELLTCPQCGADWTLPASLRDRLRHVITEHALLVEFVSLRNAVFHGSLATLQGDQLQRIEAINKPLLVVLRNFIGSEVGLVPVSIQDLPLSGHDLDMTVSVFYTMPKTGREQGDE